MGTTVARSLGAGLLLFLLAGSAGAGGPEGSAAPPLRLPDLEGTTHSLDEWRGQVVLLNFWASWCGPCQYEIPHLNAFQARHAGDGLQVIGVGVDRRRPLANVARSLEIGYPVLVANPASGARLLAAWGNGRGMLPYNVVIGRDGRVLHTRLGEIDGESFAELVAPLLSPQGAVAKDTDP